MSNEKNETPKPKDPDPVPQVIAPSIEEPKPKATKDDEEDNKKKAQPEEPKKTTPQKEGSDKKKDPNLELLESYEKMVADIQKSVNGALKDMAKAGWDKAKQTEVGQAVGRLADAVSDKVSDITQQLKDKAGDKLDALNTAFGKTTVGQAITSIKETMSSIPDKISKGLVDAIDSATEKVSKIGTKAPEEELNEDVDQQIELDAPEGTKSEDLLAEAHEAFGDMKGWDDLLTEKPKTPTPSTEPALDDSLTKGMT
ncbi:hypothetical protein [Legionella resiliens]|uniref:Coiled-coil protein n=1 Tax=Legionella resiliens TaxID=2905958 RepID=A0ABS8X049_9GAMM|nr:MULTISPECIES: hypothetical protein [unclassified Legionella]MCE0722213.1 hypothetical protein [Legionella sp. 9fVS26]MCE3531367.1 hypothetical protein [Legionella sp. 8cVS16]